MRTVVVCLLVVIVTAGCAARGEVRAVRSTRPSSASAVPPDSLEVFMEKVRAQSERARPRTGQARTVETSSPTLAAALQAATDKPSAATHRAVAAEYVRLGVLDVAHEHFSRAVALDPRDGASWDGLARIWRDWGFPHLALPDAYRALHFAPDSPVVHNTLGTVFQALGRRAEARKYYERALALDAQAAYALTNLCYGWVLDGEAARATDACQQALRLRPDLEPARNNLALAYATGGNFQAALATFAAAGDRGRAAYNRGILHLAQREYREALNAFDEAQAARPRFSAAEAMARQARARVHQETER